MREVIMNLKRLIWACMLGTTLIATVQAAEPVPPARVVEVSPELRMLLGSLVTEGDVAQLFAHLRASMRAAAEGRQPPPFPEALGKRLEAAGNELQVRGLIAGMALTRFVESAVRDAVRELAPPPAPRDSY
jgi:hypothetical protein